MTLQASWFNAGVYKNALRRFKWGSVLYFVILFFSVPFMFLVDNFNYSRYLHYKELGITPNMLMETEYMIVPILTAYAVSVIVAVIMHRYMHEARQSISIHSMPLTRRSNYISNLLAGFTLMFAPVVANGIILLVMSLAGYGNLFTPVSVICWMGENIEVLFVMFSVSTFAAFLTGQWAAHIAITVLLHLLPIIAALGIAFFSDIFLYGYIDSAMSPAQVLMRNAPFVWMFPSGKILQGTDWIHLHINNIVYKAMAIALYVGAYFVYKRRKVEACGDVAAFKAVRHILKFGITAIIMLAVSAISYEAEFGLFTVIVLNLIFGAIGYFATEMVLSKSLKVFGKYKGFAGFCVAATLFVSFFAFTSVFGYETRVPDTEKVKSASIYNYSDAVPFVDEEEFINHVTQIHKELVEDVPVINPAHYSVNPYNVVNVSYEMKNGGKIDRRYYVSQKMYDAIMTSMYENETYKLKAENVYYINTDGLNGIQFKTRLHNAGNVYTFYFNKEQASQLVEAYKDDLVNLSYETIENANKGRLYFNFDIHTRVDDTDEVIENLITGEGQKAYGYIPYSLSFYFDENYEKTVALLKEWGHYDAILATIADNLYICSLPVGIDPPMTNEDTMYSYKDDVGYLHEFQVRINDCVRLSYEDGMAYVKNLIGTKVNGFGESSGDYYAIYWMVNPEDTMTFPLHDNIELIAKDNLPDYLKKYVK